MAFPKMKIESPTIKVLVVAISIVLLVLILASFNVLSPSILNQTFITSFFTIFAGVLLLVETFGKKKKKFTSDKILPLIFGFGAIISGVIFAFVGVPMAFSVFIGIVLFTVSVLMWVELYK